MSVSFQQTDTTPTCLNGDVTAGCSGRSKSTTVSGLDSISASVGGSAGSSSVQTSMGLSESNVAFFNIDYGPMPNGFQGVGAGTATIKLNVTTGFGGTPTVTEVHLCRLDSGCSSLSSVGSVTGLTQGIAAVAVVTFNITTSKTVFAATDRLVAVFVGSNGSSMAVASGQVTPDQIDVIPLLDAPSGGHGALAVLDLLGSDVMG